MGKRDMMRSAKRQLYTADSEGKAITPEYNRLLGNDPEKPVVIVPNAPNRAQLRKPDRLRTRNKSEQTRHPIKRAK